MPKGVIVDPLSPLEIIERKSGNWYGGKKDKLYLFQKVQGVTFNEGGDVTFTTRGHSPGWAFDVKK
jgi:hypothetical protein